MLSRHASFDLLLSVLFSSLYPSFPQLKAKLKFFSNSSSSSNSSDSFTASLPPCLIMFTTILDIFDVWVLRRMVLAEIDRHDLVQCALVSKTWHRKVIPILWTNIRDLSPAQQASFQQLVLEDYRAAIAMDMRARRFVELLRNNDQTVQEYRELQQQLLQSDRDDTNTRLCAWMVEESDEIQEQLAQVVAERVSQMRRLRPATTLGKYGCWVSKTPDIPTLLSYLWPETDPEPSLQNVQQGRGSRAPSKYDMLRHFLERCPYIQFPSLVITQAYIDDGLFLDDLAKRVLPTVQELVLDSLSLSFSNFKDS